MTEQTLAPIIDDSKGAYFDGDGVFIPKLLADDILSELDIITAKDNEETFYFDKESGLWKRGADPVIKSKAEEFLGTFTKRNFVEEALYYVKLVTQESREIFDEPLYLIPVNNGILNINDQELYPYSAKYHFLFKIPVNYVSEATCPIIEKFLSEIVVPENIELLKEIVAYCLLRDYRIQKALMLVGDGNNGKSTFLSLVVAFLGRENISSVSLQDLEISRFASARLYNKMANIYADLTDQAMYQTGRFKMLTGGDIIEAEHKFKDSFRFVNYAKLLFSCNKMPVANDETGAFYRRWVITNFPNCFEGREDKTLLTKMTSETELSGLLNVAVAKLKVLLETNSLSYSMTTEQLRETYVRLSDSVGAFVMDMVETDSEAFVIKDVLYNAYAEYCRNKNYPAISSNTFHKRIPKHCNVSQEHPTVEGQRKWVWRGIRLADAVQGVQAVRAFANFKSCLESPSIQENKIKEKGVHGVQVVPKDTSLNKFSVQDVQANSIFCPFCPGHEVLIGKKCSVHGLIN